MASLIYENGQTDRRQAGRETDIQADRETDRQTDWHEAVSLSLHPSLMSIQTGESSRHQSGGD